MRSEADAVVIGGAFAGSAAALLLRREHPDFRIVLVEKSTRFDRKVGEATTEVSGNFLTRRLGMMPHLNHHHLYKQGLRFWFTGGQDSTFEEATEVGANYQVKMPTYQIDREVLDEELLRVARSEGVEVLRPARVREVELASDPDAPMSKVSIESESGTREISTRWVIDASGRASVIGRKLGLVKRLEEHPTNALWARFRNVTDWDSHELGERYPKYGMGSLCSRASATNHLTGYGWWCWVIPLRGGDYSLGLVYDSRLYTPPEGGTIAERLLKHVMENPVGRVIFEHAEPIEGDAKAYSHLPYYAEKVAGPGWQIIGDAAGFMDPLYSQGLDYGSWTVSSVVNRVRQVTAGEADMPEKLNEDFRDSYNGWFGALYRGKYEYLGDAELMTAAYLMDIGLFFFGPVRTVVEDPEEGFGKLPFTGPVDRRVAKFMAFYNRRLVELARCKRERGTYGAKNARGRISADGFAPELKVSKLVLKGMAGWARAELEEFMAGSRPRISEVEKPVVQPHTV